MRTMLVVDDDPAWRALYQMALGEQFTVFEAADGLEALSVLASVHPDVIVLDLKLPRMDGLDFLRALDRKGVRTPVVVCSGALPDNARDLLPGISLAAKSADLRYLRGALRDALGPGWQPPRRPATEPDWLD